MSRLFYISDLHLKDERELRSVLLCKFLNEEVRSGDTLIFGGDIFDLFIGNKNYFKVKFRTVLSAISSLEKLGCQIFYLEGNHDFHLHGIFDEQASIKIIDNPFGFEWYGKKIWVAHGDEINRKDYGYLLLRYLTRSTPLRLLIKVFPGNWIGKIGEWSSRKSRVYSSRETSNKERTAITKSLFRAYAEQVFANGFGIVFIGHSHFADDYRFTIRGSGDMAQYVNVGYSADSLPYACLDSSNSVVKINTYEVIRPKVKDERKPHVTP